MTTSAEDKYRIWDAYWQDSRLYSAGFENPEIEAVLDQHWAHVAAAMPDRGLVLDVACGNGAAAVALARAGHPIGKAFGISGIDAAAIDPPRYVSRYGAYLKAIDFHGRTRMEELPFHPNTFDGVISQFGVEYGDLAKASWEIARVLKPNGIVSILALPASSATLEQSARKMRQSQHILTQTKLFDVALAVAQALYHVESSGEGGRDTKQYLERFNGEVERVMARFANAESDVILAVVLALQKVFTDRKSMDIATQLAAINALKSRVVDHVARAEVTARCALGDAGLNGLKRRLTEAGIVIAESKPISLGNYGTIAWRVGGRKGG